MALSSCQFKNRPEVFRLWVPASPSLESNVWRGVDLRRLLSLDAVWTFLPALTKNNEVGGAIIRLPYPIIIAETGNFYPSLG